MKYYFKALSLHFKSELEYRISFICSFISQIIIFFSYYFLIISLFSKFNNIKGFTLYEVLLCFSVVQFGFSFNEVFARGIDRFDNLIIRGEFDRLLLRPRNIILQVLCSDSDFVKSARLIQAIIVLIVAILNLSINWNIMRFITLILMLLSACIIFFGIFLVAAAYCFYTVQGLEVRNVFTDGGKHIAQYPISIYHKTVKFFFTFVIPYGFVNYYPLKYLLGKTNNILYMLSPLVVFIFLIPCLWSFQIGLKHYNSTGS